MMDFPSLLAKGFLVFSDAIVISPLLIFGFISKGGFFVKPKTKEGSDIWGNATLLVLFTMIFNVFLKSLFLIPLNPTLGIKGYAFPSGHMQVAVVFYGWLAMVYANRITQSFIIIILTGIGYGLIQQGYHNIKDVMGGIAFGILTVAACAKVRNSSSIQKNPSHLGLYFIPLAGTLVIGRVLRIGISRHIIITYLGLVSFSLLWLGLSYYWRGKKL